MVFAKLFQRFKGLFSDSVWDEPQIPVTTVSRPALTIWPQVDLHSQRPLVDADHLITCPDGLDITCVLAGNYEHLDLASLLPSSVDLASFLPRRSDSGCCFVIMFLHQTTEYAMRCLNADKMLGKRHRRWSNIVPALRKCMVCVVSLNVLRPAPVAHSYRLRL